LAAEATGAESDGQPRRKPDPSVVAQLGFADRVIDVLEPGSADDLAPVGGAGLLEIDQRQGVMGVGHGVDVAEPDVDLVAKAERRFEIDGIHSWVGYRRGGRSRSSGVNLCTRRVRRCTTRSSLP